MLLKMVSLQQLVSLCGYCINFLSSFEPFRNSKVFKVVNVSSVVTPTLESSCKIQGKIMFLLMPVPWLHIGNW